MLRLNTGIVGFGIIVTGTVLLLVQLMMSLFSQESPITESVVFAGIAIAAFIAVWVGFVVSIFAVKHASGTKWGERGLMLFLVWTLAYLGIEVLRLV